MLESSFTEFKLDFPGTQNHVIGHNLSENICTGEHIWRIACYPRGFREDDKGEYLSLYMWTESKSKNISPIFEAFVMGKDGAPSSSHAKRTMKFQMSNRLLGAGWHRFVKRSDLESFYEMNGVATLVCGIIVLRDNPVAVPASDIGDHLGRLLDCTDGSDVSFSVGGVTFRAHRAVLAARSPVFKVELFGSMAEATMPCITLLDIEPALFEVLLRFMYTDALPADKELRDSTIDMFQHLLAAADRYALDRLKLVCAQKLWDNVSVDTVAVVLACAEKYNCPQLKDRCIGFLMAAQNFKKAVLTEGFVQLGQKFPSIIAELRERAGT